MLIMSTFDDAIDYVNRKTQDSLDRIEKNYVQKLKKASDAVVMRKLRQAEEEGHYLYDVTYQEARKRGLV